MTESAVVARISNTSRWEIILPDFDRRGPEGMRIEVSESITVSLEVAEKLFDHQAFRSHYRSGALKVDEAESKLPPMFCMTAEIEKYYPKEDMRPDFMKRQLRRSDPEKDPTPKFLKRARDKRDKENGESGVDTDGAQDGGSGADSDS